MRRLFAVPGIRRMMCVFAALVMICGCMVSFTSAEGTELAPEGPYGPVERRAARLLRLTGSGVRTGWLAVMTEDERTERAFRRLAGTGRLEELEARLALLIAGLEAEQ